VSRGCLWHSVIDIWAPLEGLLWSWQTVGLVLGPFGNSVGELKISVRASRDLLTDVLKLKWGLHEPSCGLSGAFWGCLGALFESA